MEKRRFEKIMNLWSSHEIKASPELVPKEEMYRRLEQKKKGSRKWFFGPLGWTVAATAAAVVLLFFIYLPNISKQSIPLEEPSVSVREDKSADETAAPRGRLESVEKETTEEIKKGRAFNQLFFQQQNKADKSIVGVDIQTQRETGVKVTPLENFRLQVQLNQESYVYIFQVSSDQQLTQLFPNAAYNIVQNPLKGGPLYNFPDPPLWLPVNEDTPGGTIYIIASDTPQQNWDSLFDRYDNLRRKSRQQEIVQQFLDDLETMSKKQDIGIEVQKFSLKR